MKCITWLSVLGLLVATLVSASQQMVDEFGGSFLPIWKTLLLYYGLFDHHGQAVEGHVNMDKTDGKGLINKRDYTEGSPPGKKPYKLTLDIGDRIWVMDCTWDTDIMRPELLSMIQRSAASCPDPQDLEDLIRVKLLYRGTCIMYMAYDTICCLLEIPMDEGWQAFLWGESSAYPYLSGTIDRNRNECVWQTNIMQCGQNS